MSTAAQRQAFEKAIRTQMAASDLAFEVARAYRWSFDRLADDLEDRLKRYVAGMPAGGVPSVEAQKIIMAQCQEALRNLKLNLTSIAPDVAAYTGERMNRLVTPELQYTLAQSAKDAPAYAKPLMRDFATASGEYVPSGSLLRQKILTKLEHGSYWVDPATGLMRAAPPIHHRLIGKTEEELRKSLTSGETYNEIVLRLEKEVFGVDYLNGPLHPALPDATGKVADPDYGKRPGFAKPDNPSGVLGDVQRLATTELNDAYHKGFDAASEVLQEEGLVIGEHIELEGGTDYGLTCPTCGFGEPGKKYSFVPKHLACGPDGSGDHLYSDYPNGKIPSPPFHPWCQCEKTGYIFAPERIAIGVSL